MALMPPIGVLGSLLVTKKIVEEKIDEKIDEFKDYYDEYEEGQNNIAKFRNLIILLIVVTIVKILS